jgi:hypothetical protein
MSKYSEPFGRRVAQILREKKLSPYDVARLSDGEISHQTVRNMIKGQFPSPLLVVTFARAVEVNPNELLDLTGWQLQYTG